MRAVSEEILDLLPDPICVVDAAGKVTYANRPAAKTLGADTRQELLGKSASDFQSLPLAARFWIEKDTFEGSPKAVSCEADSATENTGAVLPYRADRIPLFDDDDDYIGLICIRRDNAQIQRLESEIKTLRNDNDLLNLILNALPDLIFAKDVNSRFLTANMATARVMGAEGPAELIGKTDIEFYPLDIATQYLADEKKMFENAEPVRLEQPINRLDGTYGVMVSLKLPIFDDEGKIKGYIGNGHDITEQRAAEYALRKSEAELAQAQFLARIGSWSLDIGETDVHCSDGLLALAGLPQNVKMFSPREMLRLVDPADRRKVIDQARQTLNEQKAGNVEIRVRRDRGCKERRIYQGRMSLERAFGGSRQLCGFCLDITDQRRAEKKLETMAYTDSMTGLLNRLGLRKAYAEARERNGDALFELLIIDLDGFKNVNDVYGHQAGDQVLVEVADRLRACAGHNAIIARLGGDEFAIVPSPGQGNAEAETVAQACVKTMRLPIAIGELVALIGASVGISSQLNRDDTLSELLTKADTALYQVKREGRNGYRRYESGALTEDTEQFETAAKLRHAAEDEALALNFQPAGWGEQSEAGYDPLDPSSFAALQKISRQWKEEKEANQSGNESGAPGRIGEHPEGARNDSKDGSGDRQKTGLASSGQNGDIEDGRLA
ncbi:MAG TPA: diguanylate cyclase, partial [Hyphomicrobiales bacterium]|nr:diguanylate cyclase [Hyphomicrobiales bacterium]